MVHAALDGQVHGDEEELAEEEFLAVGEQHLDRLISRPDAARALAPELAGAGEHMGDDRYDEVVLRWKVVRLRAPRHAGDLGDVGGAKARVALLGEQVDGGIEDAPPHLFAAFTLRAARLGGCGRYVELEPGAGASGSAGRRCHSIVLPPLTLITCPVTNAASREAR